MPRRKKHQPTRDLVSSFRFDANRIPRKESVGCSLTHAEQNALYDALQRNGYPYPAIGVRGVLMAYAGNKTVQQAVAESERAHARKSA